MALGMTDLGGRISGSLSTDREGLPPRTPRSVARIVSRDGRSINCPCRGGGRKSDREDAVQHRDFRRRGAHQLPIQRQWHALR
jgi:hypothetical protein